MEGQLSYRLRQEGIAALQASQEMTASSPHPRIHTLLHPHHLTDWLLDVVSSSRPGVTPRDGDIHQGIGVMTLPPHFCRDLKARWGNAHHRGRHLLPIVHQARINVIHGALSGEHRGGKQGAPQLWLLLAWGKQEPQHTGAECCMQISRVHCPFLSRRRTTSCRCQGKSHVVICQNTCPIWILIGSKSAWILSGKKTRYESIIRPYSSSRKCCFARLFQPQS